MSVISSFLLLVILFLVLLISPTIFKTLPCEDYFTDEMPFLMPKQHYQFGYTPLPIIAVRMCLLVGTYESVSHSGMRSLCGRSDCPPLRTILCRRKCIGQRHAGVRRDVIWSSQVVLGRPLERLQQRLGGHPSPDSTADIERMLYAGTWHHVNVLYNGWACCGCEGESGSESGAVPRLSVITNFTRLHSDDARLGLVPQVLRDKGPCHIVSFTAFVYPPSSRNDFLPLISDSNDSAMRARHYK